MKNKHLKLKCTVISRYCKTTALILSMMLSFVSISFSQTINKNYIDGEIYVKIKDNYKKDADFKSNSPDINIEKLPFLNKTKKRYNNFRIKSSFYFAKSEKLRRTFRISTDDFENIDQLIRELELLEEVEYAEKIPLNRTSLTPNDLGSNTASGQWGLHKIQAQSAWDITTGSSNIVVAVVDDAIMTTHPDLAGKFVTGRDVSDNDADTNPPQPYFRHGTHVAGIVGASTNNGTGVASIGYNVSIMPIKATPDSALPEESCNYECVSIYHAYEGVAWAANNGADVINMSWGGYGYSATNQNTINAAAAQGAVLVAAAGNANSTEISYPAGYNNVISVAATDINDNRAGFSNYGSWIDVSAPGASIRSTVVSGGYANWNGTSMASPMVAGLCGLVLSVNPGMSPTQVENCITTSADALNNSGLGAGRINAYKAVQCLVQATCTDGIQNQGEGGIDCDGPCPPCVNNTCNYTITNNTGCEVQLRWTDNNGSFWDGAVIQPYNSTIQQIEDGNLWSAYNTANGLLITPSFTIAYCSSPNGTLPASACSGPATCTDGIQNQGEGGIDCDGPCPPCINNTCNYTITNSTGCEVQLRWTDNNGSFWDGAVIQPYGSAIEQIEDGNFWSAYNTADGSLITPTFAIANCSSPNGTLPASACNGQSDCISSIGRNGNITGYTEVQNNIVSPVQGNSATVNTSSSATFDAGTHVSLNPGFTAEYGSVFNAFIDGCDAGNKLEIEQAPVTLRNYPNPFTGQTTIEFVLTEDSPVTLFISDMTGKKVAMLLNSEIQTQGAHLLTFDGSNYPAGMYYYTIQAGEYFGTQKMILVK